MFNGSYAVDLAQLMELVDRLDAFAHKAVQLCETVDSHAAVIDEHWKGHSAKKFQEHHTRWDKDAAIMCADVTKLRQHIIEVTKNYDSALRADAGMWD